LEGETVEDPLDLEMALTLVLKDLREKAVTHGNVLEVQRKVLRNHGDEVRPTLTDKKGAFFQWTSQMAPVEFDGCDKFAGRKGSDVM
jgi:hypothetical protein